jgi:hypothetical protein
LDSDGNQEKTNESQTDFNSSRSKKLSKSHLCPVIQDKAARIEEKLAKLLGSPECDPIRGDSINVFEVTNHE